MPLTPGTRLGPYEVVAFVGAGGMGQVYRARDSRLRRDVAIKVLASELSDQADHRQRFEREAFAIAAINHPNICALYDIGSWNDNAYLVMEFLEGESLAARLARGPIPSQEALPIAQTVLDALGALHRRGLVHRDLKPANVFLTPHGVKLLDFGLARQVSAAETMVGAAITQPGIMMGTPRYMAPEQIRGGIIDARSDVFAVAIITYEMLAGSVPFDGSTMIELIHAVAYADPKPLPPGVAGGAVEDALRRAMAKDPDARPPNAAAFAQELKLAADSTSIRAAMPTRLVTRLIVMPLRILRADPDTDFLAFSLSDALAASLAGLDSVVVRSPMVAARFANAPVDLRALASEADVNAALTGTLMRAGDQVRVSAQLIEVPGGALIWSHTVQAPVQDLFQLQDVLTTGIVTSLKLPLTSRERQRLQSNVPTNPEAYELYLRANQLMTDAAHWQEARELYERAVELDSGFPPAWARLGRVLRVMTKFGGADGEDGRPRAERAFERALALAPDLALAHHLYTYLEVETGRAEHAMVRLLQQAQTRRSDPELFAGLVTTCRYCGLLDASLAAYDRAHRLDPLVNTSVTYTFYVRGEFERTIETDLGDGYATALARHRLGRTPEARAALRAIEDRSPHAAARIVALTYRHALEHDAAGLLDGIERLRLTRFRDPEGFYLLSMLLPAAGLPDAGLEMLDESVRGGYHCHAALSGNAIWDPVRDRKAFQDITAMAAAAHQRARVAFEESGGPALLTAGP